jgi:hypothetical protein
MFESIGWVATAMFAGSYFLKRPASLRNLQAMAALLWICYGLIIKAWPVVVANVAVAISAAYNSWRQSSEEARSGAEEVASYTL